MLKTKKEEKGNTARASEDSEMRATRRRAEPRARAQPAWQLQAQKRISAQTPLFPRNTCNSCISIFYLLKLLKPLSRQETIKGSTSSPEN